MLARLLRNSLSMLRASIRFVARSFVSSRFSTWHFFFHNRTSSNSCISVHTYRIVPFSFRFFLVPLWQLIDWDYVWIKYQRSHEKIYIIGDMYELFLFFFLSSSRWQLIRYRLRLRLNKISEDLYYKKHIWIVSFFLSFVFDFIFLVDN